MNVGASSWEYDSPVSQKGDATAAIERAQGELDEALARLAQLPTVDSDRLAYAVHALNNYLMVVSTIAHVLRLTIGEREGDDVRNKLESLNHATTLMRQMVRDITFEGPDQPRLIFLPVDLTSVVSSGCDEYEPIAAAKQISLLRDFSEDARIVRTDVVAFGAVLDNILSNAVKYSAPGGTVRVGVQTTGDDGICAVSDSGPGIKDEEAPRLFSHGGRLSSRPTGGESSTGYGLAIARDLMNALGGRIWFENNETGGTTFSVSLPLHHQP